MKVWVARGLRRELVGGELVRDARVWAHVF